MLAWLKSKLQMPVPAGPAVVFQRIEPQSVPVTRDVVTLDGNAWRVQCNEPRSVRLFEVQVADLENCMLTYRASLKTENAAGVYLEMWCRFSGRGEYFSKGFHDTVRGTTDWSTHEIPFLLRRGQSPDLLKLDLAFKGPGTCWISDIELLRTPFRA
jgi:hypothetical protein